jgi:hypothetical protein
MGQKKGQTGNPNGRPKGKPNKVTAEMKEKIQLFIASNFETIQKDYETVDPKDRLIIFERLLKYVIPAKVEQENIKTDEFPEQIKIIIDGKRVDLSD